MENGEGPEPPSPLTSQHRAVRGALTACGAALVLVAIVAVQVATGGDALLGSSGASVWTVPLAFALYGALWESPLPAAGLTWLGVESALVASAFAVVPTVPWGAFLWYATAGGFVAGLAAFAGSWVRGTVADIVADAS